MGLAWSRDTTTAWTAPQLAAYAIKLEAKPLVVRLGPHPSHESWDIHERYDLCRHHDARTGDVELINFIYDTADTSAQYDARRHRKHRIAKGRGDAGSALERFHEFGVVCNGDMHLSKWPSLDDAAGGFCSFKAENDLC